MSKVGQFKGLPLVPPIGLNINYQHNFPTAIQTLDELLRKTKKVKHKATYLNDELQTNGPVTSAYKYLCDYFGIAFRCSAEGISELLKKLTNKEIQKTLKQENVENIARIVESHKELIKLIIKAKENNNNPTIKEIEQNPHLISTLNIKTLTDKEKIDLLNSYHKYFSPKEIRDIMDTLSFGAIEKINLKVFYDLFKENPEEAMNFLNKRKGDNEELFIYLSCHSNFIENCIEGGLGKEIHEIMDTLSFGAIEKINSEVFYYLSKESPEEAMNFLNKRRDKRKILRYLSWNSNFIENCIKGGLGKEIRDIIFELNLQNYESFKNVMKKLK